MKAARTEFQNPLTTKIVSFLRGIGIEVERENLDGETVLPGINIRCGTLLVDESKMKYPGDLLHEAGHIAVVTPDRRGRLDWNVGMKAHEEMMAIAWSYAAAVHLGIDPAVVFHPDGYRGGGGSIIENFNDGRYVGVCTLEWIGLTAEPKRAEAMGVEPYPNMLKWLAD